MLSVYLFLVGHSLFFIKQAFSFRCQTHGAIYIARKNLQIPTQIKLDISVILFALFHRTLL